MKYVEFKIDQKLLTM